MTSVGRLANKRKEIYRQKDTNKSLLRFMPTIKYQRDLSTDAGGGVSPKDNRVPARTPASRTVCTYQSLLKTTPNQPDVVYNMAIIHKFQGKTKAAISKLEKALKINKGFIAARIALDDLYTAQGDNAKARKEIYGGC